MVRKVYIFKKKKVFDSEPVWVKMQGPIFGPSSALLTNNIESGLMFSDGTELSRYSKKAMGSTLLTYLGPFCVQTAEVWTRFT